MQGIIFVTWEKYLAERFGNAFLNLYRETIGETQATVPLTSRVYEDELLLAGVGAASKLTHFPIETLLREYGRYFLVNGLTSHLCAYLLAQAHSGRELLLMMRQAHAQMRKNPDGLTPPVFRYEMLMNSSEGLTLIYDNHRQLCPVLYGAIEGAAERFGERAKIVELTCMKNGAAECRFEVNFVKISAKLLASAEQVARNRSRQHLADMVLNALPDTGGLNLQELQRTMQHFQIPPNQLRPSLLLEALNRLQFAGLVASTANQGDSGLAHRRFWRVPIAERQ
jgi:hypothetical protein